MGILWEKYRIVKGKTGGKGRAMGESPSWRKTAISSEVAVFLPFHVFARPRIKAMQAAEIVYRI
jgi:hypothetical protein